MGNCCKRSIFSKSAYGKTADEAVMHLEYLVNYEYNVSLSITKDNLLYARFNDGVKKYVMVTPKKYKNKNVTIYRAKFTKYIEKAKYRYLLNV